MMGGGGKLLLVRQLNSDLVVDVFFHHFCMIVFKLLKQLLCQWVFNCAFLIL